MSRGLSAVFMLERDAFSLHADLELPLQGVTGIFGASGCGKTSLLRCIAGLERPYRSSLHVDGQCWQDSSRGHFLPAWKRPVGTVFQEARLFPHMTVRENLCYGMKRKNAAGGGPGFDQSVDLLSIGNLLERKPGRLSGGEQQRVAIGRALLTNPRLLLMDEPLASLDYRRKAEIMPFLERLHDELDTPILYVSHSLEELMRLADRLVLMEAGRTLASGPLSDMLTRLDLPLVEFEQAAAVLNGTVESTDADYRLATVVTPAGRLIVEGHDHEVGQSIRLRIHARDVSLSRSRPEGSSILNILPASVREIGEVQDSHVTVQLDAGGVALLSRVSYRSCDQLELRPGMSLYAQIKGVAIEGV